MTPTRTVLGAGRDAAAGTAPSRTLRPSLRAAIARLVARRLAFAVPMLVIVSAAVFALGKASPFDPVAAYFGVRILRADPQQIAAIRADWGFDDPALQQYGRWLGRLLTGDLGDSRLFQQPVSDVIAARLGWSVLLVATGLTLAVLVALGAGLLAARREGGWFDRGVTAVCYALEAAPVFWLALAALSLFAVTLQWLPAGGATDPRGGGGVLRHLLLPAAVLGVSQAPWFALFVRQSTLQELREDHVLAARARGLRERTVLVRHALRTALLPLLTLLGARIPELITGALLVETVFSWPGIAAATVGAATAVDFPLLAALTLMATVTVLLGNLLADVLHLVADPRVRADG